VPLRQNYQHQLSQAGMSLKLRWSVFQRRQARKKLAPILFT